MDKVQRKAHIATAKTTIEQLGNYLTSGHQKGCNCSLCKQLARGNKAIRELFKEASPEGGKVTKATPPKVKISH